MICDMNSFVDNRVAMLATQYRESENLISLIRNILETVDLVGHALCDATVFDIDVVTGDQLSIIGKVLGWPRTICSGVRQKTFGFECDDGCRRDIGGFCTNWQGIDCGPIEILQGNFTFEDDDLYRRFLKSLVVKHDGDFRRKPLVEAMQILFGPDAGVMKEANGHVDVFTGRSLSDDEFKIAHVVEMVLPVALGVSVGVYETSNGPPFGFGDGWGGFCDSEFPVMVVKGY